MRTQRPQRAESWEWLLLDRAAARAGYVGTARWLRDVGLREALRTRYRVERRNGEGDWLPVEGLEGIGLEAADVALKCLVRKGARYRKVEV